MLRSPYFETESLSGNGATDIDLQDTMLAVTFVDGAGSLQTSSGTVAMTRGRSAVVPAAAQAVRISVENGTCYLSRSRTVEVS